MDKLFCVLIKYLFNQYLSYIDKFSLLLKNMFFVRYCSYCILLPLFQINIRRVNVMGVDGEIKYHFEIFISNK